MNEDKSFIVISRKMLKWEWYQDSNTKNLFLHLLLMANWEDKKWQGIDVKRGCIVTSLKHLSEQTGLSIQQIRTSINKLISTNEITKVSTTKYTIISINNYNKYQDYNKQVTNEQQTSNKRATTTKQYNNITNKQKEKYKKEIQNFLTLISNYSFGEKIISLFSEYLEIRVKNKYTMTENVIKRLCSKLIQYSNNDEEKEEIILNAINGAWKDFYPLKEKKIQKDNVKYQII